MSKYTEPVRDQPIIALIGTRRCNDHITDSLAGAGFVEDPRQQTGFFGSHSRIRDTSSGDCPAVKRCAPVG